MPHRSLLLPLLWLALPGHSAEPAAEPVADGPSPSFEALLEANQDLTADRMLASLPERTYRNKLGFNPRKAADFKRVDEALQLTDAELKQLDTNGFAIVDHDKNYSFGSMYYAIYVQDLPVLVTTDSILHAMHRTFDDILKELEVHALSPTIDAVLARTHAALGEAAAQRSDVPDYYADVDVYLTVARNLLAGAGAPANGTEGYPRDTWDGELLVPSVLNQDALVRTRLQQVQALKMQTPDTEASEVFGAPRMVDYTQFRPRGHYTKSTELKRYFRAMMWLGRVDCGFELAYPRQMAGSALLSQLLADSGSENDLAEMDTLIGWLIGSSDNLGPEQVLDKLQADGIALPDLDRDEVRLALRTSLDGRQRIRSQLVVSNPDDPQKVAPPQVFQLFGQRFILDSFVLSQVVFDSIVFKDNKVKRMMPSGLDVAAALGNDEAVHLLAPAMKAHPYAANLQASRQWVAAQPEGVWSDSVYNTWLDTLRPLDDDRANEANMPAAMQTRAWQKKQLQTQLASWAELRHDTILYAKQSYTAWPGCEYPAGYVEPYPEVYAGVARVAGATADAIEAVRFETPADAAQIKQLQDRQVTFLRGMGTTLSTLEGLARKELAGKPFTPAETRFLKKTIDQRGAGSGPPMYDGWYPGLFYRGGTRASEWGPEIADVHTNPKGGAVLEVGTGDVDFLVAAIDNEGDTRIFVGPAYSYYEFEWPAADRLTDQKWSGLLRSPNAPNRPAWMSSITSEPVERTIGQ